MYLLVLIVVGIVGNERRGHHAFTHIHVHTREPWCVMLGSKDITG